MNVDPSTEKYSNWSPYSYVFNNPLNVIDPDGRDGIRIIDKKNKSITIKAIYYVQTESRPSSRKSVLKGYSTKQISEMETKINNWYNKQNLSVNEGEFEGYSIQFDLSFKEGGYIHDTRSKANLEEFEGYNIGNSFERANSKTNPTVFITEYNKDGTTSTVGGVTDSKKFITMNATYDYLINWVHEIAHTLSLDDNKNTDAKGGVMEYPPGRISQQEANLLGNNDFLPKINKQNNNNE